MKLTARHAIALIAVASSLIMLTGCGAIVSVQPGALSLSDSKPNEQVSISNDGSGTLNWTAESTVPWLLLSFGEDAPQAVISGSTSSVDIFDVHLVTAALPEDAIMISTEILIRSNGGDTVVPVTISRPVTPKLDVEPASLEFGSTETEMLAEILNRGEAVLQWEAAVPEGVDWVTITPASGAVARASAEGVMVAVNRSRMTPSATPYRIGIQITSNGGAQTLEVVVEAPAFTAAPAALDFGLRRAATTQTITVETPAAETVSLTTAVAYATGAGWLQVAPATVDITNTEAASLLVTATPGALAPGVYTATVNITHAATARTVSVPVSMEVGLPISFRVEPTVISFGDTRQTVQQVVTLINEGAEPIEWVAVKPDSASWLTVNPPSGLLEDTFEVTLIANPAALSPGAVMATVVFDAGGVTHQVRTSLNRLPDPVPDSLEVEPRELDFGSLLSMKEITLWNDGPSGLNWSIDGASLPAWLSVSPLAGFVEGDLVQNLQVTVDRGQAPAEASFSHTFVITPTGAAGLQPVEVTVRAEQLFAPQIVVTGEGVSGGVPSVLVDIGEDGATFTIRNEGNAPLNWRIDETWPAWIASVNPSQGIVNPGREQTVAVTVNRTGTGLDSDGGAYQLRILSDDPEQGEAFLEVQVRVPFTIIIKALPGELNFDRKLSTVDFEVTNMGDLGTELNFVITPSDSTLISVDPQRNSVISTSPPTFIPVSVAVDREALSGSGAVAYLTISAENLPDNVYPVAPVQVPVIIDAAELTIETAVPRGRPASLLRFNMLLRDAGQRVFPEFVDNPLDLQTIFPLNTVTAEFLEDSEPIDLSETNILIKKDETLSFAVLIMLDFSASMAEAAQMLVADGQLDPGTLDPLEALYIEAIGPMLDAFPPHYRVALGVFNERRPDLASNLRLVTGAPGGYPLRESSAPFTSDKDLQQYRLLNMEVSDHGATPLYPTVTAGVKALMDLDAFLPDFDAVANRILVAVTDGRRTTPPGDLQALLDLLELTKVRAFTVGWGSDILANPLIQMSTRSGGHYYGTKSKTIGLDPDGNPIEIPVKDKLLDRCRPNPDAPSVPRDLAAHVVVSYVTLNEEETAQVRANVEVSTVVPSVKDSIAFDQLTVGDIVNDIRLGQIGARSEGIQPDATARVRFYADYAPRNVTRMVFEIGTVPIQAWTPVLVPAEEGGLIADWAISRIGNRITVQSVTGRPLTYGDYGNLFDINVTGIAAPFDMTISILEPVISGNPDGKYFTLPDLIPVRYEPTSALSFPNPEFAFAPPAVTEISNVYDLGSLDPLAPEDRNLDVAIENIGGEHIPTNATLYWKFRAGEGKLAGTLLGAVEFVYNGPISPDIQDYYWVHDADAGSVVPTGIYDEFGVVIAEPGTYSVEFFIDVYYGSLGYTFAHGPYYLRYTVP